MKLGTHDMAVPFSSGSHSKASMLRAILLAPDDLEDSAAQSRIDRLYHLNGGRHVVVVFLLQSGGTNALMRLQLR